jgi:anhydro-N-acetylmuramic acid kinase
VAAGGQGAPLVPAFHQAVFSQADKTVAVLNIGGISNLSVLAPGETPLGMDCGPGNVLLDLWCRQHLGQPFDRGGAWSAGGKVHGALMRSMRSDPYFARALPKSTGRDHFHAAWLAEHLNACGLGSGLDAEAGRSVQATLAALTAQCVADELTRHGPLAQRLWVCGGGAFNADLLNRLQQALPNVQVASTQGAGMAPDQVEACAFAWLARQYVLGRPGNVPGVTGAQGWRRLGALYPGL